MSDAPETKSTDTPLDFDSVYANNTVLEISAFDLKILFGQLDQSGTKSVVDWHTAVTLPWAQAKILSYFLQAQIAWYEKIFVPIAIPTSVIPPAPEPPPDDENNPLLTQYFEIIKELHAKTFGS
jgi:hypothetical protein